MLPSMSWQNDVLAPHVSHPLSSRPGRRSKQNPRKHPVCYRATWPGRDRRQRRPIQTDEEVQYLGHGMPPSSLPSSSSNDQERSATLSAALTYSTPPTHPSHGPAHAVGTSAMTDLIISSREAGTGAESRRARVRKERGRRKGWTRHHASMMLAPCPKRSRPGTLQS